MRKWFRLSYYYEFQIVARRNMRTHPCSNSQVSDGTLPRLTYSLLLPACVAFMGLAGCGAKTPAGDTPASQAMPVQVQVVESRKLTDSTEYLAILKSRHSATINPQVEGQITKIFVKSGDRVATGAPLLQIDPLKQQATVNSQEAARVAQLPGC